MALEVELKARLHQPAHIETKAARLGRFGGEFFKEDIYFRRRGDSGRLPDDRFRLRREGDKATVTFKQAIQAGGLEVNDEVEFGVDEARAFFRFADRFGFEPFVVKRKKSRLYRVGRAQVEINQVTHLGHFAEIEIMCSAEADVPIAKAELLHLLMRLNLKEADLEPRRYIEMIQEAYPVQYRFVSSSTSDWPFEEIACP